VAIYPKEGAFWTRHPVGIPEEAWVTPIKRMAAERYIAYLLEDETQYRAMKIGLRPISQTIQLEEPFASEYGVRAKIDASNVFSVPDERVLRRVRDLWEEAKMPASIVLLLDISGSMKGSPISNAKRGAITFIHKMSRRDELEVITFSDEAETLVKLGQIRENGETAKMKIWNLRTGGYTCLYDAIKLGLKTVSHRRQRASDRRYGIIVLSDGVNTRSTIKPSQLMASLPKGDAPNVTKLFTIAYGKKANREFLNTIADATNARMFQSTTQEIEKVYRELSANF
jgi:Ca-activated chloride channel family protein